MILIFPAMLFSHVEGWSFGEGFCFAFITLSTFGFGDYVVGENEIIRYPGGYSLEPGVHGGTSRGWLSLGPFRTLGGILRSLCFFCHWSFL